MGLLENVRVRRAGFPYRVTYTRFIQRFDFLVFILGLYNVCFICRYKSICNQTWPNPRRSMSYHDSTLAILNEVNGADSAVFGHTKVFISDPHILFCLEEVRTRKVDNYIAVLLQKVCFFSVF